MQVDFDAVLFGLDGQPIPKTAGEEPDPTLLKDVCVPPLVSELPDEKGSGDEKFKRWQLAGKIAKGGTVEVTADEVKMLKDRIGKGYGPVIVGPAYTLLEALKS